MYAADRRRKKSHPFRIQTKGGELYFNDIRYMPFLIFLIFPIQNAQSDETQEIPLLFDPSTEIFWEMIYGECIMILIFSILGIGCSFYRSKRKKNKILSNAGNEISYLNSRYLSMLNLSLPLC